MNTNQPRPAAATPHAEAHPTARLTGNATVAALGGLLFGFDAVVISGTTDALQAVFGLSEQGLARVQSGECDPGVHQREFSPTASGRRARRPAARRTW